MICLNHNIDAGGNCRACGYNTDVALAEALSRGEDPYGYVPEIEQCSKGVYSIFLSAPERCALWAGHDGECEA